MAPLHVRLYSKPGCDLCDQAALLLETLRPEYDFVVEKVNIENDPMLRDRLSAQVPVVTIDGGNRIAGNVNDERLRRALKRARQAQVEAKV